MSNDRQPHQNLISQWAVFMLGGGHFAGAVFRGAEPVLHKTFHCYTVRAKQGGSQVKREEKRARPPSKAQFRLLYRNQLQVHNE